MRVAVRVDASPRIGGGHAMRCLTLANEFAGRGADVVFVAAAMPEALGNRIEAAGHKLARIAAPPDLERQRSDWHQPPLDSDTQAADARATGGATGGVEWLIVDHYLLDAHWHAAAHEFAERLLVIDDLANREYDCDLLLDQTFGRDVSEYADKVPATARVLAGSNYALLRPEFERERRAALDRRREATRIERILISMGTGDVAGSTEKILIQVLENAPECHADVVIGPGTPSFQRLTQLAEERTNVTVHVDPGEMARLMRDADLSIGAGGTTSWERCCLGLPSIALILAENQRASATALTEAGAVIAVEQVEDVGPVLRKLLEQPDRLSQMSAAAFAITDGRGAERVASVILGREAIGTDAVRLRPATERDIELLWLWRNDPVTRSQSRNTDPISWKAHLRWVRSALGDPGRKILIGERDSNPVGNVGFHRVDGDMEVSIVVAPGERGKGVGRAMLSTACADMPGDLYAAVRTGNEASRRLFESCGFEPVESSEAGFARYLRRGEQRPRKQA